MRTRMLLKGIGLGVLAGTVITAAIIPMDKKRIMRSKAGKALKTISHVVDGVTDAFM